MTLQEQRSKDPNAGIFTDTSGRISENVYLNWSRIYSFFDDDDFSTIPEDQLSYISIKISQLHLNASRPAFMPYTNVVKWILDHAKPEERVFNDDISIYLASFRPEIFAKAYVLSPPKQLINHKFVDEAVSRFNYE